MSKNTPSHCLLIAIIAILPASDVAAHQRDFPVTYDWLQPSQGEREIELHSIYRQQDRSFEHQVELEIGVTRRFMIAPYLVYTSGPRDSFHMSGVKLETRYQLGNFAYGTWLPGLYAEYEKPGDGHSELEGKLILSRYDRHGGDLSINLIGEKTQVSGSVLRTSIAAGYARPLARADARIGAEVYKSLDDGQVNAGPTIAFSPGKSLWAVASYGFAVNNVNGNRGHAHLMLEWEF